VHDGTCGDGSCIGCTADVNHQHRMLRHKLSLRFTAQDISACVSYRKIATTCVAGDQQLLSCSRVAVQQRSVGLSCLLLALVAPEVAVAAHASSAGYLQNV
jgi:hypothetical protein